MYRCSLTLQFSGFLGSYSTGACDAVSTLPVTTREQLLSAEADLSPDPQSWR